METKIPVSPANVADFGPAVSYVSSSSNKSDLQVEICFLKAVKLNATEPSAEKTATLYQNRLIISDL